MVTHKIKRLPKSTIEIEVDIPKSVIESSYKEAFKKLQENLSQELGMSTAKAAELEEELNGIASSLQNK